MRWWEELQAPLLGRYRVERLLGRGGMAEVLLARDERFDDRRVAIKAPLLDSFAPDQLAELLLRFRREVQRQGSEPIAGVVSIIDAGEVSDASGRSQPFLVMDYLSGGSLGDALGGSSGRRERTQTLVEVLEWLRPVATTLDRLHARKYLHRDVKPDNILFNADGDPFLSDFGIATSLDDVAGAGTMMSVMGSAGPGSPGYQSPESLRGEKLAASDQFSLAATAYEALAGRLPMNATTRDGWIGALANWKPTPLSDPCPDLPTASVDVLMRALSVEPRDRYLSCSAFAQALADAVRSSVEVVAAKPQPAAPPAQASAGNAGRHGSKRAPKPRTVARPGVRRAVTLAMLVVPVVVGLAWWATRSDSRRNEMHEVSIPLDPQPASRAETAATPIAEERDPGRERDDKELATAALAMQDLDADFDAAVTASVRDQGYAGRAPEDADKRKTARDSALDAARKGLDAAKSAEKLLSVATLWLDTYHERREGLLAYALDVAERAADAARHPEFQSRGGALDPEFVPLASEAEAVHGRIETALERRKQAAGASPAADPKAAVRVESLLRSGDFYAVYGELVRRVGFGSEDAIRCTSEESIKKGEGRVKGLRYRYFSTCLVEPRTIAVDADVSLNQTMTGVSFRARADSMTCTQNNAPCPDFGFNTNGTVDGTAELVTLDLVLFRFDNTFNSRRVHYTLLQRNQT